MSENQDQHERQESSQPAMPIRRRSRRQRHVYHRPPSKGLWLGLLLLLLVAAGGYYYYQQTRIYYIITMHGKRIVALASSEEAAQAIEMVRRKHAPAAPQVVTFVDGEPEIIARRHDRAHSPAEAAKILDGRLKIKLRGFAIFVDNAPLVMLGSKEQAAEAISLTLERGLDGKQGIPTFKQRVVIDILTQEEGADHLVPIMTPEQAAKELTHPPRPNYHTVANGDSFWTIANANGLLVSDLDELNPTLKTTHLLHIGDKVRLPDILAPVTVVVRPAEE